MTCENPACGKEFTPKPKSWDRCTRHCSNKCWHAVRVTQHIATDMTKAREARMNAARRRLAASFKAEFGSLTKRDLEIIRLALRRGYNRGFKRGYTKAHGDSKKEATAAADRRVQAEVDQRPGAEKGASGATTTGGASVGVGTRPTAVRVADLPPVPVAQRRA